MEGLYRESKVQMILSNISQFPRCLKPALASVLRTWHDFVVVPETASPSAWRGRHADGKLFSARGRGRVYVCVCVCTPERETESLSRTVFTYRRYRPIGIRQSGKSNGGQKASEIIVEAIKLSPLSSLNRSILSLSLSLSLSLGNIGTTRTMLSLWLAVVRNCRKMAAICGTAYGTCRVRDFKNDTLLSESAP